MALSIAVGFRERESRDGKEGRKGGGQVQRDRERQRHIECREMLRDPCLGGALTAGKSDELLLSVF